MFSGLGKRVVAAVVALSMLAGCAEIDRRGGTIAEIEDHVLFIAQTKSHRLFRSYLLIGVLLAAARQGSHNEADVAAIEGNLKSALSIAFEAYNCLYPDKGSWVGKTDVLYAKDAGIGTVDAVNFQSPAICQFFDEKMARLDYALYRLALSSLFNEKTSTQLASIRDKLVGEIPVLSAASKAAIFGARAVNQATTIVDDLLNLSFSSLGPAVTLLPLYRDALEVNMWVIADTLTRACPDASQAQVSVTLTAEGWVVPDYSLSCQTKAYALAILNLGNGDLRVWRDFVSRMNYIGAEIEAYAPHFALVSRLIWRSCRNLLKPDDCNGVLSKAADIAYAEALYVKTTEGRTYSASIGGRSRLARQPRTGPSESTTPNAAGVPPRDPDATGSVDQKSAPSSPVR